MTIKIDRIENGFLVEDFEMRKTKFYKKPEEVQKAIEDWLKER